MKRPSLGTAACFAIAVGVLGIAAPPTAAIAADCAPLTLNARVVLGAALFDPFLDDAPTALMRDDLRTGAVRGLPVLPASEPYSALGFYLNGGEGATGDLDDAADPADDVVDWVLVELRLPSDPTQVVATDAILVQRDGDLARAAQFAVPAGNYYVAIQHRNHLGVMTALPVALGGSTPLIDFADPAFDVWDRTDVVGVDFDGNERYIHAGVASLWWGDANNDGVVIFEGADNEIAPIQADVLAAPGNFFGLLTYIEPLYRSGDVNLDGAVVFSDLGNDPDYVFNSVDGFPLNTARDQEYRLHLDQVPAAVAGPDLSSACVVASPELAATGPSSGWPVGLLALGAIALGASFAARARFARA